MRISYTTLRTNVIQRPLVHLPREKPYLEKPASSQYISAKPAPLDIEPDHITIRTEGLTILDIMLAAIRDNGYEQIEIIGDLGSGKSTIGSWLVYAVFCCLGSDNPWMDTYNHTVFTLEQFNELRAIYRDAGLRIPIVLWDDAGMYLSLYRHQDPEMKNFTDYLQAVREDVAVLLFTMPDEEDILKRIRRRFTGEIVCKKAYVKRRGITRLERIGATYSIRVRDVSWNKFGKTYDRKIIIHGKKEGTLLTCPPLPNWYRQYWYLPKKNEAKEDTDRRRSIFLYRQKAPKIWASLLIIERKVLQALRDLGGEGRNWVALRDLLRYFKQKGINLSSREIDRRLTTLKSAGLALRKTPHEHYWKITSKGLEVLEVNEERAEKCRQEIEEVA